MTALAIIGVLAIPLGVVLALLRLVDVRDARRQELASRQIALTDAIHSVLGPVVAPVVRRRRGGFVGVLAVARGDADVARMVDIARAELGPAAEIVLVLRESQRPHEQRRPVAVAA